MLMSVIRNLLSNAIKFSYEGSNTGSGMNDKIKSQIFEPFFSTKKPGEERKEEVVLLAVLAA